MAVLRRRRLAVRVLRLVNENGIPQARGGFAAPDFDTIVHVRVMLFPWPYTHPS